VECLQRYFFLDPPPSRRLFLGVFANLLDVIGLGLFDDDDDTVPVADVAVPVADVAVPVADVAVPVADVDVVVDGFDDDPKNVLYTLDKKLVVGFFTSVKSCCSNSS
jgi:hypothetical protein